MTTSYLYVQEAESGQLVDNRDGTLTPRLTDVSPQTLAFSDRPIRDAFYLRTSDFSAAFDDKFGDDPPNAALTCVPIGGGREQAVVFVIDAAVYDREAWTLTYNATRTPVSGSALATLPGEFGEASLFLDDASSPVTSTSWQLTVYGSQRFIDGSEQGVRIIATFQGQTLPLTDGVGRELNATFTGSGGPPTGYLEVHWTGDGPPAERAMRTSSENMGWEQQGNVWNGYYYPLD